jgi:hypothetical protein
MHLCGRDDPILSRILCSKFQGTLTVFRNSSQKGWMFRLTTTSSFPRHVKRKFSNCLLQIENEYPSKTWKPSCFRYEGKESVKTPQPTITVAGWVRSNEDGVTFVPPPQPFGHLPQPFGHLPQPFWPPTSAVSATYLAEVRLCHPLSPSATYLSRFGHLPRPLWPPT